ncbi:DUF3048 domain-containing protein [Velocimicrobium porci]|uniref:DUF3048 domain-containing protein n=1 Tax=Velocimicrobium porci TaxID=2606634 RepID=A0A6L5Y0T3_9FIRM|nr:DUF3048 domain-containing protein [Velocimicrobium porci]MSS64018.1 DUF3048 domain-containing protein [Velocimicrobium porci]
MKKIKWICVLLLFAVAFTGCKKEDTKVSKEQVVQKETKKEESKQEKEENHDGEAKSRLTGLWVDEKIAKKRPYAVMLNNIKFASPQSSTEQASILYEAVVEGGITRLMGLYEDFDSDRIGSARSARHYYVSIADEYDAIYVHYGQTPWAIDKMKQLGVDNLSGLEAVGSTVFYRDNSIKAPHNAFASKKGILKGTEIKGYRTEYKKENQNHFNFYDKEQTIKNGKEAKKVELGFSSYTTPYFKYDKKDKTYYRWQFGEPHIDAQTKKQLHFKNLILQFVKQWDIGTKDYQTMDIENSSGTGYYITNGKATEITWKKKEASHEMYYYDLDGNILSINPGKSYIALYPEKQKELLKFYSEEK